MEPKLNANQTTVLQDRILARDAEGNVVETPGEMFDRVARTLAADDTEYSDFLSELHALRFLPNSPCLVNAGRPLGQLAACFVLPIEDSIEGIMYAAGRAALIHQSGGGTGFDFSSLRESGSRVTTTGNVASGPLSFIDIFDTTTGAIKQGGVRRGANMGILRVDHPDILAFIDAKRYHCVACNGTRTPDGSCSGCGDSTFIARERRWQNFNVSIAITDEFLEALSNGSAYTLWSPLGGSRGALDARMVWRSIAEAAWDTGDPGLFFVDRVNAYSRVPGLGQIAATNPCGEVPLLPNETCNLGSLDVSKFIVGQEWDLAALDHSIGVAVRFLNRVIDNNNFPDAAIEAATRDSRKIGLGVMGWADALIKRGIRYDSAEGLAEGNWLMGRIQRVAHEESKKLAYREGNFPAWDKSVYDSNMRNSSITVIAPTGTIAKIAETSSGIEPLFSTEYVANVMDKQLYYSHPLLATHDASLFRTAPEISPEWHLKMQAAFQQQVDDSISKTVNMPFTATVDDVEAVYNMAIEAGVKGVTLFRDGCLTTGQVLSAANTGDKCPLCSAKLVHAEGCTDCTNPTCGYSACEV